MNMLQEVDELEVTILVDNTTDMLSSNPTNTKSETASLFTRGGKMSAGRCLCCAVHGYSCLVRARRGSQTRTVLFDTGPEDYAFERNVSRLAVDLGAVDAIVLSHGHWDHAGALLLALSMILQRNGGKTVPFYGHPQMFRPRAVRMPDSSLRPMEDLPTVTQLTSYGAEVVLTDQPAAILDGMFYVSGEIPRHTSFERGFPGQMRLADNGSAWEVDELMMDERWLGVNVKGKGLVVFSACSHAGIVNVLNDARSSAGATPLHAVFGGFHLSGPNEAIIADTIEGMRAFGLKQIASGHCTGWRATSRLAQTFGEDIVTPSAVGKRYVF